MTTISIGRLLSAYHAVKMQRLLESDLRLKTGTVAKGESEVALDGKRGFGVSLEIKAAKVRRVKDLMEGFLAGLDSAGAWTGEMQK